MTQIELANLLGVSRRTVIDWESDTTKIPTLIVDQTRKRGRHGPVMLFWHTQPTSRAPGHRMTELQQQDFETVEEALDRACDLVRERKAYTAHILDHKTHEFLWDLPSLRREIHRRKHEEPK